MPLSHSWSRIQSRVTATGFLSEASVLSAGRSCARAGPWKVLSFFSICPACNFRLRNTSGGSNVWTGARAGGRISWLWNVPWWSGASLMECRRRVDSAKLLSLGRWNFSHRACLFLMLRIFVASMPRSILFFSQRPDRAMTWTPFRRRRWWGPKTCQLSTKTLSGTDFGSPAILIQMIQMWRQRSERSMQPFLFLTFLCWTLWHSTALWVRLTSPASSWLPTQFGLWCSICIGPPRTGAHCFTIWFLVMLRFGSQKAWSSGADVQAMTSLGIFWHGEV